MGWQHRYVNFQHLSINAKSHSIADITIQIPYIGIIQARHTNGMEMHQESIRQNFAESPEHYSC